MTTLADVDRLVADDRYEEANVLLDELPDTPNKAEYEEMFYRCWSYAKGSRDSTSQKHGARRPRPAARHPAALSVWMLLWLTDG